MKPAQKKLLICVVGATAIGKTALAIKLAQAFETEIISADSRQFFKEMAIGTAVPSTAELQTVPHHFVQNKSIFDTYSVGDFERDGLILLKKLFRKKEVVVLVGGSGLYVDAVVKGLDKFPNVPAEIREQLNKEFTQHGIVPLQNELEKTDPSYYQHVDLQNPHRLIRALEIVRATGKPYSSFLKKENTMRDFNSLFIGLTADRKLIYERIDQRVDKMVAAGLVEEAKRLHIHKDRNALQTVGYRELFDFFDGKLSLEEAISEIKKNTRRFAKRQNTWFKKNEAIHWFDYSTDTSEILSFIKEKNAL